jgi:SAM-dependent methyltransferase
MRFPFSEEELRAFWHRVLDPSGIGLMPAIAAEIASYTSESADAVQNRMRSAAADFNACWLRSGVDSNDGQQVAAFYRDQFVEAYELAYWHAGGHEGELPLNYARAALLARMNGWTRALDFGCGIGSGSVALGQAGCHVDCADVANRLLGLTAHRMRLRGLAHTIVDLGAEAVPDDDAYDVITCFDVLEHVPDQYAKLVELQRYLRPGGVLLVNLMTNSESLEHRMHISSAPDRLGMVRRTGMRPVWAYYDGDMQALRRTRGARIHNRLATVVDKWARPLS